MEFLRKDKLSKANWKLIVTKSNRRTARVNDYTKLKVSGSVKSPKFIFLGINFSDHSVNKSLTHNCKHEISKCPLLTCPVKIKAKGLMIKSNGLLFEVKNKNTRRRSGVFIVNFEYIYHVVLLIFSVFEYVITA